VHYVTTSAGPVISKFCWRSSPIEPAMSAIIDILGAGHLAQASEAQPCFQALVIALQDLADQPASPED
jgi:hypothetical protein